MRLAVPGVEIPTAKKCLRNTYAGTFFKRSVFRANERSSEKKFSEGENTGRNCGDPADDRAVTEFPYRGVFAVIFGKFMRSREIDPDQGRTAFRRDRGKL